MCRSSCSRRFSISIPTIENPALRRIARIWKRESALPLGSGPSATRWTIDHIGIGPSPSDYVDGVARPASERRSPLPFGFAFENQRTFEPLSAAETTLYDGRLLARRVFSNTSLLLAKMRATEHEDNWERDRPGFGSPGSMDRVFLSCAACHVGRVVVDGKIKFLPGMPNTEIEAQYFSKLLMLTAAALVESGFDPASTTPVNPANIRPNTSAVRALYTEMLDKARQRPETLYGSSPADIARAKIQTLAIADEFPSVMQDLIAVGVKTHFIYYVVAKNNAYRQPLPDVLEDRPGQMDAFGIASGLVAIHTRRPDNSFLEFVRRDNPQSPIFTGFSKANGLPADVPGMTDAVTDAKAAADRIFKNIPAWAPPVPAPDRRQERQLGRRSLPRQLGWQPGRLVAHARVRSVGDRRSAHGQRAHPRAAQPVHRQPAAAAVSVQERRSRAGAGGQGSLPRELRLVPQAAQRNDLSGRRSSASIQIARGSTRACHATAWPRSSPRRARSTASTTKGRPAPTGACRQGDWQARLDEYFRDTPRRVVEGTNGYKADMLHGIWAQAPYLHNGSVPTLGQLLCPATRPQRFLRGNLRYDEALVGFEWADRPTTRYSPNEILLVKEYDTAVAAKANSGHTFGSALCPDTSGLDPVRDRREIETRIRQSSAGALLEYLKTL